MSDFISNSSDGKSDLYTFTPNVPQDEKTPQNQEMPPSEKAPAPEGSFPESTFSYAQTPPSPFSPQPPSWNHFAYAPPPPPPPPNPLSTTSMILGIVTWGGLILCCGCFSPVTAILSIIFALVSRENKKMNGKAVAGLVLGLVFLFLFIAVLIFLLAGGFLYTHIDSGEENVVPLLLHLYP